jgi:hypothetical protein
MGQCGEALRAIQPPKLNPPSRTLGGVGSVGAAAKQKLQKLTDMSGSGLGRPLIPAVGSISPSTSSPGAGFSPR